MDLGFILPHEHILIDTSTFFVPTNAGNDRARENEPISLANLSWVRYNARHSRDCLSKMDEEAATNEVDFAIEVDVGLGQALAAGLLLP